LKIVLSVSEASDPALDGRHSSRVVPRLIEHPRFAWSPFWFGSSFTDTRRRTGDNHSFVFRLPSFCPSDRLRFKGTIDPSMRTPIRSWDPTGDGRGWTTASGRRIQMIARENETLPAIPADANADPSARLHPAFGPSTLHPACRLSGASASFDTSIRTNSITDDVWLPVRPSRTRHRE
jgi:hypothetical protein